MLKAKRIQEIKHHHFTDYEARELSVLRKGDPVLRLMVRDREIRWDRFSRIARWKLDRGLWRRSDLVTKWYANLSRWYGKYGWRAKGEWKGSQPYRQKGKVNVWAAYRSYERVAPPKQWVSPWQVRQIRRGKTKLAKGLIFVQQLEKQAGRAQGLNQSQIRDWIEQKNESIKKARGSRRVQLTIERNRLERLL